MNTDRNQADFPHRDRATEPRRAERSRAPLSPDRIEQIRERIRERAYDSDAVREATARCILGRGDV
jgi:hypothetical protein